MRAGAQPDADATAASDGRPGADPLDVETAQSAEVGLIAARGHPAATLGKNRAVVVILFLLSELGRLLKGERFGAQFRRVQGRLADVELHELLRHVLGLIDLYLLESRRLVDDFLDDLSADQCQRADQHQVEDEAAQPPGAFLEEPRPGLLEEAHAGQLRR
ncbi:MAG: hypothetical protein L6306_15610 [Planctomycetales bacterium]|nr:hypothetical protein [Planctomycetales bacterium]